MCDQCVINVLSICIVTHSKQDLCKIDAHANTFENRHRHDSGKHFQFPCNYFFRFIDKFFNRCFMRHFCLAMFIPNKRERNPNNVQFYSIYNQVGMG